MGTLRVTSFTDYGGIAHVKDVPYADIPSEAAETIWLLDMLCEANESLDYRASAYAWGIVIHVFFNKWIVGEIEMSHTLDELGFQERVGCPCGHKEDKGFYPCTREDFVFALVCAIKEHESD